MSDFITYFTGRVIAFLCCDKNLSVLVKFHEQTLSVASRRSVDQFSHIAEETVWWLDIVFQAKRTSMQTMC